ncbi:MAG TPA: tRNA (adenosine(37)-N6)-threonylcarbamoyltransferase complex ATPase subunit type 1 TsaE [Patescibacteria group bacterium]|nr:tRNA (adenosine(37)-N6)-threonylcarbamoyltransferase complex ATPase subunit type 1 TsaE [Patescibacteria group bacterium]
MMLFMNPIISNNPKETKKLAATIASKLKGGAVIGLAGELGAGKTVFVQGLAEALGVKGQVNSPTFVLMKVYGQLVHVDAYRLSDSSELREIGLEEYFNKDRVVVIEWADKVKDILPEGSMMIEFKMGENENQREIEVKKA